MKWLKENECPWGKRTFAVAACEGNLINLKWLKENDVHGMKICFFVQLDVIVRKTNSVISIKG